MSATGTRGPAGRPAGPGGDVRAALIRAAATHFSANGYAGASVRAILDDAGTTAPALYHHFTSKAGLYVAVAEAAYADVLSRFGAAPDVEGVLDAVLELRRAHPHAARFLGVIEQDVTRHPELSGLRVAQQRVAEFWSTLLGRAGAGQVLATRAIVEGFLRVGDENVSHAELRSAAGTLRTVVRGLGG
jgi:AcrR family transcriptional regulator